LTFQGDYNLAGAQKIHKNSQAVHGRFD